MIDKFKQQNLQSYQKEKSSKLTMWILDRQKSNEGA